QQNQDNQNIDLNYISPQRNTSHKLSSPHPQQHSVSPSLEETLAILRTIPPGNPREYKERESEPKQPKLQQYAGLKGVIERFHEIMTNVSTQSITLAMLTITNNVNNKPGEIGSPHTTHPEQEIRNPNTSQPKVQPPLITKPPELGQVKGKVVVPKQKTQQVNEHDTRSRT
ncbi:MAG: hypothetical protein EZS28_055294, partial [Streblomastix strix]